MWGEMEYTIPVPALLHHSIKKWTTWILQFQCKTFPELSEEGVQCFTNQMASVLDFSIAFHVPVATQP